MTWTAVIAALALFTCAGMTHAKDYRYHAPKVSAYHAPKTYTPRSTTVPVRGYFKPTTGTYVAPHYQTAPNATKVDNWSSKPNVNPYTGKAGTKDPYSQTCCTQ